MWSTYFTESLWQYTINTQFKAIKADKFSFSNYPHLNLFKNVCKMIGKKGGIFYFIFF
jgi:hypothetical protein